MRRTARPRAPALALPGAGTTSPRRCDGGSSSSDSDAPSAEGPRLSLTLTLTVASRAGPVDPVLQMRGRAARRGHTVSGGVALAVWPAVLPFPRGGLASVPGAWPRGRSCLGHGKASSHVLCGAAVLRRRRGDKAAVAQGGAPPPTDSELELDVGDSARPDLSCFAGTIPAPRP